MDSIKQNNEIENLTVTKLKLEDPYAKKMMAKYLADGEKPVNGIPDWVVYKYKDGKFKRIGRFEGYSSKADLIKKITNKDTLGSPRLFRRTLLFRR